MAIITNDDRGEQRQQKVDADAIVPSAKVARPDLAKDSEMCLRSSGTTRPSLLCTVIVMLLSKRVGHPATRAIRCDLVRPFSVQTAHLEKPLPPRIVIPESDITESFLKGSGPGGQKINKTSSAVQLKHLPTGVVVKSQETRSREQNRKNARRILGERLEELEKGPRSRTALKAEKARKKKASAAKKSRRKYRELEEGKAKDKAGANASAEARAGIEESSDDCYMDSASHTVRQVNEDSGKNAAPKL